LILKEYSESKIKLVCLTILNNLLDVTDQSIIEKRVQLFNEFDMFGKLTRISNEDENKEVISQANRILVHLKTLKK